MTRFFYTDPLAAAWMAKHFAMRFTAISGVELNWDAEFACFFLPDRSAKEQEWEGNHYVHPDSMHLLEPQDGDFIEIKDPEYYRGKCVTVIWHAHSKALHLRLDHQYKGREYRIIQRNSIPFHWPESEPTTKE